MMKLQKIVDTIDLQRHIKRILLVTRLYLLNIVVSTYCLKGVLIFSTQGRHLHERYLLIHEQSNEDNICGF